MLWIDLTSISNVAGMIADAAKSSGGNAARIRDLVAPAVREGVPGGVLPVLKRVDSAATQTEMEPIVSFPVCLNCK